MVNTDFVIGFHYRVEALVRLSAKDVEHCMKVANQHYDACCRSAGKHGGFLYGYRNRFNFAEGEPIDVVLDSHELDTLGKILEMDHSKSPLSHQVMAALGAVNAEYKRLNEKGVGKMVDKADTFEDRLVGGCLGLGVGLLIGGLVGFGIGLFTFELSFSQALGLGMLVAGGGALVGVVMGSLLKIGNT